MHRPREHYRLTCRLMHTQQLRSQLQLHAAQEPDGQLPKDASLLSSSSRGSNSIAKRNAISHKRAERVLLQCRGHLNVKDELQLLAVSEVHREVRVAAR